MTMGDYTIKDLEQLSGIKAHTIRIWEKRYGLIKPQRTDTNRRRYTDEDLRKLINISILNRNGFKISSIASMSFNEIQEKVSLLTADISEADTQIEALIVATINLDEANFSEQLDRQIKILGFEDAFTAIVFPFLHRVGNLWLTGSISPGQEHFVSNLVRQKIISGIESQEARAKPGAKKVLLFLPENELHEIGLLFLTFLTRKHGHEVLYLGAQTPLDSLKQSMQIWPPDILVTGTLSNFSGRDNHKYLREIAGAFPDRLIIVTGLLAQVTENSLPGNIRMIANNDEYISLINK
ncbi:MAG: MerR family transcriptional regulator [Bacteroidales bacterium]|nr:MerR family transcriptional regulator [Bacteroidales bacterium]